MNPTAMVFAGAILLAFGLTIWAWWTMVRVEQELIRSLGGLDAMHFEIGTRTLPEQQAPAGGAL